MADLLALATAKMGQTIDMDGAYGGQCMDLIVYVVQTAYGVRLTGNAIDTGNASNITALQNAGVTVQRITNRSQLQRGDIVVFSGNTYGHVGIVEEPNQPTMVQQNFSGKQYVTRDSVAWEYYGVTFAYGLRLSKGNTTTNNNQTTISEEEKLMLQLFKVNVGWKSLRVMNTATGKSFAMDATASSIMRRFLNEKEPMFSEAEFDNLQNIMKQIV